jgi:transposase
MAAKTIEMELIKTIIELHRKGEPIKSIARLTGVARNTVKQYLKRAEDASFISNCGSKQVEKSLIYNTDETFYKGPRYKTLIGHFEKYTRDLHKKGVTRHLLWQEYMDQHNDGYGYSQYCYYLQQFLQPKDVVMHLEYRPAEMIMIDFAGTKFPYADFDTAELLHAEVFVATLPYSGLIFFYAVPTQRTADFADAINAMLKYFGGVTSTILCDNLKTAVKRSDRYEPLFTDLCYQLSDHYKTTFSATRPYKPRDKALVEKAVNLLYKTAYAPVRNRSFTSIKEINVHLHAQSDLLNCRPYKGSAYSRRDLFEQEEKALLQPLPSEPLQLKKGVVLTVQRNYHIQLSEDHLYYSVPYQFTGKKVQVWYNSNTIEIYYEHERIALHQRTKKGYNTCQAHMPPNHQQAQQVKGWTREQLLSTAKRTGPSTYNVAEIILSGSIYMEQNYKACFGMLQLAKRYGQERLEAACKRALASTKVNYRMIINILQNGLDKQTTTAVQQSLPLHDNIRGPQHYR